MSDIESLVQMLKSDDAHIRYDACEKLSTMQTLTSEAIDALYPLTIDENQDVADMAQRALSVHALQNPESSLEAPSLVPYRKTTAADYAIGGFFIGTVVSGLLIFLFFTIFGTCTEVCPYVMLGLSPILGILTAIISGILGAKKIHKD